MPYIYEDEIGLPPATQLYVHDAKAWLDQIHQLITDVGQVVNAERREDGTEVIRYRVWCEEGEDLFDLAEKVFELHETLECEGLSMHVRKENVRRVRKLALV